MKQRVNSAIIKRFLSWFKEPAIARSLILIGLGILGWLAFLWNLGEINLVDETEPLFAEASRQMIVRNDWITPYFNEYTRFDKPPLIYWLMALGYQIIGVNEWAVRLPSALSAIALMFFGFYTLLRYHPSFSQQQKPEGAWQCAGIGAILIALNPETLAWGRTGVSDMLLTSCMAAALLAFFIGYVEVGKLQKIDETSHDSQSLTSQDLKYDLKRDRHTLPQNFQQFLGFLSPWYFLFYVFLGLAVLAKGPVGIVLPALIIGSFLLYLGQLKLVAQEMQLLRGIFLVATLTLPWYLLCFWINGEDFINSFFGYHNLERFTSVVNQHSAPWYFYFVVVLLGFAPWSIYLPVAITRLRFWQRSLWRRQPRGNQLGLFAGFWFVGIFGFFSIAVTKLPSYVLPLMPAAAILVALLWTQQLSFFSASPTRSPHARDNGLFFSGIANLIFLLAVGGAIFWSPHWIGDDPAMPNLAPAIAESGLPLVGSLIWILSAITGSLLLYQRKERWLLSVNIIGFLACLIFALTPAYFLVDQERQQPIRQLAETIIAVREPQEEIVMIAFEKPSLVFYTQQPVAFFRYTSQAVEHLQEHAEDRDNYPSVLIVAYPKKLADIGLKSSDYQLLDQAGGYVLVRFSTPLIKQLAAESRDFSL